MCLLDILQKLKYKTIAIHLNHNWRGKESRQEEENCKNFCAQNNIEFYSETLSNEIPHTETAARDARYNFFEKCAKKFNANVIFTAHNFDDNAETVLYRIIKGTGIKGLQGIQEHRDIYYRPLLSTPREEIEKYCTENKLTPNKDSSNENTKYKRNLIRKKLIPLMQEINPRVIGAINSLSELAKEDNQEKSDIRELLINYNLDYDKKKIDEIYEFINKNKKSKSGKTLSLASELWLFVNSNGYEIISKHEHIYDELSIKKEGEYRFKDYIFSIKPINKKPSKYPNDNEYKAYVELDNIDFVLRTRKDGDIIQPLGLNGTQKLKKYFNEKKVPNHKKDDIILLCKGKEVLWVSGYGISNKIKVTQTPTHIIEVSKWII